MLSSRQSKHKTVKNKETTRKRKEQRTVVDLGSTLANSRSMNRLNHSQNSHKQIPKILSKIQKNVQDLKKYCSDSTPSRTKKKQENNQVMGHVTRTINDHVSDSISSVDQIKKNYLSFYGKQTENIHQLWKFYNSFLNKQKIKRSSLTSQSVSISNRSSNIPDYSIQSRQIGRSSALEVINRLSIDQTQSANFSDLFSNRPSDRNPTPLEKVIQQQQCRPVQLPKLKAIQPKKIEFNLKTQLDILTYPQCLSTNLESTVSSKLEINSSENNDLVIPKRQHEFALFEHVQQLKQQKIPLKQIHIQKDNNIIKNSSKLEEQKDFHKKIFEKNMLINKRKQELNYKLKNANNPCEKEENYCHDEGLDEAIIIEDKPLQDYELPLSKQDISLLEKLDQIDKQVIRIPQSEADNYVFEALKNLNKKKGFQKSKFGVAQIPIKKKKPQIIDVEDFVEIKSQVLPKKKEIKEIANTSLLDCEIEGIEGEDSLLQNLEDIQIDL